MREILEMHNLRGDTDLSKTVFVDTCESKTLSRKYVVEKIVHSLHKAEFRDA